MAECPICHGPCMEYDGMRGSPDSEGKAEAEFLAASVAVWQEIDAAIERGKYQGIEVTEAGRQLRLREREAWERYKAVRRG